MANEPMSVWRIAIFRDQKKRDDFVKEAAQWTAAAQLPNIAGLAVDLHTILDRQGTGSRKSAASLHRHDTHAAGGKGLQSRVVAEVGDVNPSIYGGLQHHFPRLGGYIDAIDGNGNVIGHESSSVLVHRGAAENIGRAGVLLQTQN